MYELDAAVTGWINALAGNSVLDRIMFAVSAWGVPLLVVAVAAQWWAGADRSRIRHALVATGLAFLLGLGINQTVLLAVDRIRPYVRGLWARIMCRASVRECAGRLLLEPLAGVADAP
jgi:undecaprenyl-diphosphatase